jgi:hypothetical protein
LQIPAQLRTFKCCRQLLLPQAGWASLAAHVQSIPSREKYCMREKPGNSKVVTATFDDRSPR